MQNSYVDPVTGYEVFTEKALRERGSCCGCGCRHCPYQHSGVPMAARAKRIQKPAWLTDPKPECKTVLFWSGGKDSYLALRALQREEPGVDVVLISTFDSQTRIVAHQEIPIEHLADQATQLGVSMIGVPLTTGADYMVQVEHGLGLLSDINAIAFGDLHLEHIREWRENSFSLFLKRSGAALRFPLWHADYQTLFQDLERSRVRCVISAVTHPELSGAVGRIYDREFIAQLPSGVDIFGENGEFHTKVLPRD